jgi:hypothetical protein
MKLIAIVLPALIAAAPVPRSAWDRMSNTERAAIVGASVGVVAGGAIGAFSPAPLMTGAVIAGKITGTSVAIGSMVDISETAKKIKSRNDNRHNLSNNAPQGSFENSGNTQGSSGRVMTGFQQLSQRY